MLRRRTVLALPLLAACPRGQAPSGAVQLALDWFPEAEHGGLFAAQGELGAGLQLALLPGRPDAPVIHQVAAGRCDFGIADAATILAARAQQVPIVAVFELAPGWILRVAFGAPYTDAAPVLRILAVAIIPTVAGLAWAPLAGLRGHGLVRVTAISLIGNLALNFVLVPPLGGEGAAIATVVGQVVFAALLRASLRERT